MFQNEQMDVVYNQGIIKNGINLLGIFVFMNVMCYSIKKGLIINEIKEGEKSMSHKITKHHLPKQERTHKEGNATHREKKDYERLMYSDSIISHQDGFDKDRLALLKSKKQNKFIEKVKAEEASIAGSKTGRVKRK